MAPPQGPVEPVGQEVSGTLDALAAGSTEIISRLEVFVVLEPDAHPERRIAPAAKQPANHRDTFIFRSYRPFLQPVHWAEPGQAVIQF
jgi:hypothetical protein